MGIVYPPAMALSTRFPTPSFPSCISIELPPHSPLPPFEQVFFFVSPLLFGNPPFFLRRCILFPPQSWSAHCGIPPLFTSEIPPFSGPREGLPLVPRSSCFIFPLPFPSASVFPLGNLPRRGGQVVPFLVSLPFSPPQFPFWPGFTAPSPPLANVYYFSPRVLPFLIANPPPGRENMIFFPFWRSFFFLGFLGRDGPLFRSAVEASFFLPVHGFFFFPPSPPHYFSPLRTSTTLGARFHLFLATREFPLEGTSPFFETLLAPPFSVPSTFSCDGRCYRFPARPHKQVFPEIFFPGRSTPPFPLFLFPFALFFVRIRCFLGPLPFPFPNLPDRGIFLFFSIN